MGEENAKYFLRQKFLPDWDEEKIHNASVLCLGLGGLGSTVALGLCRLGVKTLYGVDYDVVDAHNLNRQVLYSKDDVNKSKVERAAHTLQSHHNICTEVITVNLDAVKQFGEVVALAKKVDVIFNMIDVGDYFDIAVQSLALSLNIPLCQGGTFQNTLTVDYCKSGGQPCWLCLGEWDLDDAKKEMVERLSPSIIQSLTDISFIPRDDHPVGQSFFMVANGCANSMLCCWVNDYLQRDGCKVPNRLITYVNTFETLAWDMERNPNCPFCAKKEEANK